MSENHFIKKPDEYVRDLDVLGHYKRAAALYLQKNTGKPIEECVAYVQKVLSPNGNFPLKEPMSLALTRDKDGIKRQQVIPFSQYLSDINNNQFIVAPTGTCYVHTDKKPSILGAFIEGNIKKRKASKKEAHAAKQRGETFLANFKDNEQTSFKISNNSLSGAHSSKGTILYNKSTHPSLTSTCRTATSYANANNEKFLAGNRHYWKPDLVKANILDVCLHADLQLVEATVDKFNLHLPSTEEVMSMVTFSTDLYWQNPQEIDIIRQLVDNLEPIERAAFVYIGDFYHTRKFNEAFVRTMIDEFSTKSEIILGLGEADVWVDGMSDDTRAFVSLLCTDELKGTSIWDIKKDAPNKYLVVASTAKKVVKLLDKYQDIIKAFWVTDCLTPSVANIRNSIRRAVITSDTDSTIFTTQDWTEWFVGKLDFSERSKNVSYAITFLTSQTITHILAKISAGFGVSRRHLNTLAMKNEFAFPVFSLTTMAKHYYAYISACEGNVYKELEKEVKGVQLKDSNAPAHIIAEFNKTLEFIMGEVMEGRKISGVEMMRKVAGLEVDIVNDIKAGGSDYLKGIQIKNKDSYTNYKVSNYMHYIMWEEVFADKYGKAPELPYAAVKLSVDLNNKTKIKQWLDGMEDQDIAKRMAQFMETHKKYNMLTFLLPKQVIESTGIPDEVMSAMNLRKIIYITLRPFYLMLESLGIFFINDKLTRLVSDDPIYTEKESKYKNL